MDCKRRKKLGLVFIITVVLFAAGSLWVVQRVAAWAWDLPNRITIQADDETFNELLTETLNELSCEFVRDVLRSGEKAKQLEMIQFLCDHAAAAPEFKEFLPQLKELCNDPEEEVRDAACQAVKIIEAAPDPKVTTRSDEAR